MEYTSLKLIYFYIMPVPSMFNLSNRYKILKNKNTSLFTLLTSIILKTICSYFIYSSNKVRFLGSESIKDSNSKFKEGRRSYNWQLTKEWILQKADRNQKYLAFWDDLPYDQAAVYV